MIVVRNLTFDYPTKRALRSVSLEIHAGTITGLAGPNGAGKTTLLRCLAGLETPVTGSILIDRVNVIATPRLSHRRVGLLQDYIGLYNELTCRQTLRHAAAAHGIAEGELGRRVTDTAARLGLVDRLDEKVGTLSRGLRQRLAIAQAMIHRPRVLLLDEPAAGLDPDARTALSELLRHLGTEGLTVIVSSHILAELEDYTSHLMILRNGRIVEHCPTRAPAGRPRRLKIMLAQPASGSLRGMLSSDPTVSAVDIDGVGTTARFDYAGDVAAQSQLLRSMVQAGLAVASLQEEPRSMQVVYSEKMRGAKR
ncbi:ABC-2 type transport system ATP-binding protein [uncultured Gammaproteobacteria bacterium]